MANCWLGLALVTVGVCMASFTPAAAQNAAPDDDLAVVAGNTRFALDVYDQLREKNENIFFSPLSVSSALAMTYAGARGATADEMARALHFDAPAVRLHRAFGKLLADLDVPEDAPGCRLHIANALWAQQDYHFLPDFLALGREHYRAEPDTLDFAKATEQARQKINAWVAQRTADKIRDLIPPGVLDELTRLVLTNAVYFKGEWATQFDKQQTREAPFTLADGKEESAPLMNQTGEFGFLEQPDLQVLELPYAGGKLSMVILLPRQHDGLPALEKSLSADELARWIGGLAPRKVRVSLPRFKMTCAAELSEVLKKLGMQSAFDRRADFSGMDGTQMLYISAVLHKAFVDVNEEGTEAAAATGVVMKLKSGTPSVPLFRADHPFLFLIRDVRSGSIVFMGRVLDPTS